MEKVYTRKNKQDAKKEQPEIIQEQTPKIPKYSHWSPSGKSKDEHEENTKDYDEVPLSSLHKYMVSKDKEKDSKAIEKEKEKCTITYNRKPHTRVVNKLRLGAKIKSKS